MRASQFVPIVKRLANLTNHGFKLFNLTDEYFNTYNYGDNLNGFIDGLTDNCQRIEMALLRNSAVKANFADVLKQIDVPVMFFVKQDGHTLPVIVAKEHGDGRILGFIYLKDDNELPIDELPAPDTWVLDENGRVVYLTPFPMASLVSEPEASPDGHHPTPWQRFIRLLKLEQKDIYYIYFYAFIVAAISLTLPLGIQATIELVSGGVIFSSIVLIIAFVIIGIVAAGGLQILQYNIVEVLQRRIFVKAAFEFSYRLPRVRTEAVFKSHTPELMNRFFDVLTIQKSLPSILIDLASAVLQIVFGIVLLSFYHPFFIIFGVVLLAVMGIIFYYTGPDGLKTSITESKYKYRVVHWLEEIARSLDAFKLAGHTSLPLNRTENLVNNYLYYRKKHFKVLMTQFANVIVFKTLITGGLLIMGTILVINREILIGQFVAAEVVIILILGAVEKVILSMSYIYDALTAVDKIGHVTDLPLERHTGIAIPKGTGSGAHVKLRDLRYQYPDSDEAALTGINLDIQPGERVGLAGFNNSGKNTLVKILCGLLENYTGGVAINNLSLRDINLNNLRDVVAANFAMEDIFDGTVLENVTMGKSTICYQDGVWALESVGLGDTLARLDKGLQTELVAGAKTLSTSMHVKLTLARCIAERPQLLILHDFMNVLQKDERLRLLNFLNDRANPWTLIMVSNDPLVLASLDRVVLLKDGQVAEDGAYETLIQNPSLRDNLFNC
ncbi:MAG: ATP-binding cassette domain-containing protein [Bernardetiaceae bacterium]|jgi:ABC-type bacteriocin/lantibiotic exporter with double-glycine peptidase domain|nr:ATP-binding cassette domain-containing protein [Bernardetiaceae bacterium]